MNQTNTRALIEAGFLTSIVIVLVLVANTMPMLSILATLVAPATLAILSIRHGLKWGFLSLVVTALVALSLMGPFEMLVIVAYGFIGVIIGSGYNKNWNALKLIFLPSVVTFSFAIIAISAVMYFMNIDITNVWEQAKTNALTNSVAIYQEQGYTPEQIEKAKELIVSTIDMLRDFALIAGFFSAIGIVFIISKLTEFIARRTGNPVANPIPALSNWRMPKWSLYALIVGLICAYWGQTREIYELKVLGQNLAYIGQFLFLVQGMSFIWFMANKYGAATFYKVVAFLIVIFMPAIGMAIGMFDLFAPNSRGLDQSE